MQLVSRQDWQSASACLPEAIPMCPMHQSKPPPPPPGRRAARPRRSARRDDAQAEVLRRRPPHRRRWAALRQRPAPDSPPSTEVPERVAVAGGHAAVEIDEERDLVGMASFQALHHVRDRLRCSVERHRTGLARGDFILVVVLEGEDPERALRRPIGEGDCPADGPTPLLVQRRARDIGAWSATARPAPVVVPTPHPETRHHDQEAKYLPRRVHDVLLLCGPAALAGFRWTVWARFLFTDENGAQGTIPSLRSEAPETPQVFLGAQAGELRAGQLRRANGGHCRPSEETLAHPPASFSALPCFSRSPAAAWPRWFPTPSSPSERRAGPSRPKGRSATTLSSLAPSAPRTSM